MPKSTKVFIDTTIPDYKGEPIKIQKPGEENPEELNLRQIMWLVLNNAPLKTQEDSKQGSRLATALDDAEDSGIIEMEEGTHDWLKPIAKEITPMLFRVNGSIVYEHICEGYEKIHQPKENEAKEK